MSNNLALNILEYYSYVGLILAWWYSSTKLGPALEKHKVENTTIYIVTGIMVIILWPIMLTRINHESAEEIARNLKEEEKY